MARGAHLLVHLVPAPDGRVIVGVEHALVRPGVGGGVQAVLRLVRVRDAREAEERGGRGAHSREAGVGGRARRGISDERGSRGGPRRARDGCETGEHAARACASPSLRGFEWCSPPMMTWPPDLAVRNSEHTNTTQSFFRRMGPIHQTAHLNSLEHGDQSGAPAICGQFFEQPVSQASPETISLLAPTRAPQRSHPAQSFTFFLHHSSFPCGARGDTRDGE